MNISNSASPNAQSQRKSANFLPNLLSGIRIFFAGVILWFILKEIFTISLFLFILAALTDLLDGALARRLGTESKVGAYIDTIADFLLVFITSLGLVIIDIYPVWLLFLLGCMFEQFILTSRNKKLKYDPIGKHYGTILMVGIAITLWIPDYYVISIIPWIILGFSIVCITCRIITHKKSSKIFKIN